MKPTEFAAEIECPMCHELMLPRAFPRPSSDAVQALPYHTRIGVSGATRVCPGSGAEVAR